MADPTLKDLSSSAEINDGKKDRVEGEADLYVFGTASPGDVPGRQTPKRALRIEGDGWNATIKFEGGEVERVIQKLKNPREVDE